MTQEAYCSFGAVEVLGGILERYRARGIFLVADKRAYEVCGAEPAFAPVLEGYHVTRFHDFEPTPKLADVVKGVQVFRERDPDVVIGVGGGSAIDMAKMINIFAQHPRPALDYLANGIPLESRGKPLIACPTTAGTGSEATEFAVLYVDKVKHSVAHPGILPEVAIIDPSFLRQVPHYLAATTGLDALCQAIESYWSVAATDETKRMAAEALGIILEHLPRAVLRQEEASLLAMAWGAHVAGMAINRTKTTAPHAISYPITAYFGVPHGHAVAVLVPSVFAYNARVTDEDVLDPRGADYVVRTMGELTAMLGATEPGEAARRLDVFRDELGLTGRLQDLGLKREQDLDVVVQNGFDPQRVNNNPRRLSERALRGMLLDLFRGARA